MMHAMYLRGFIFMQITRLQDQVSSLKATNENKQKQTEELINKLREVSHNCISLLFVVPQHYLSHCDETSFSA